MKFSRILIFSMFCFLFATASGKNPLFEDILNFVENNSNKSTSSLAVSTEAPGSFHLMWSDPGFVDGPLVTETIDFYVVSYTTTTYNEDSTVKYTDDWKYYFPCSGEKFCYRYNRYSGKGYHGGSLVYLFGDSSLNKPELDKVLCHEWNTFEEGLFNILRKNND